MNIARPQRLTDYQSVHDALADLCSGFFEHGDQPTHCSQVSPDEMPEPFRHLLVHNEHMTLRLGAHHGRSVDLKVLETEYEAPLYRRKIVLTLKGTDEVVEFGVMRMNFNFTGEAVKREVLSADRPLGEILVRHNVLRRIEPRWYLRFPAFCCHLAYFHQEMPMPAFGRVGTIYCNEEPAIELLEIVTASRSNTSDE